MKRSTKEKIAVGAAVALFLLYLERQRREAAANADAWRKLAEATRR